MNNKQFIKTSDEETKQMLLKSGFQLINESSGIATFINDVSKPITFDGKKIAYTNNLNI